METEPRLNWVDCSLFVDGKFFGKYEIDHDSDFKYKIIWQSALLVDTHVAIQRQAIQILEFEANEFLKNLESAECLSRS